MEFVRQNNSLNSLPNDTILNQSKFKAFAGDKIILTQKVKFVLGRVENIVVKGENAGFQHLLPFSTMFLRAFFTGDVKKSELCGNWLTPCQTRNFRFVKIQSIRRRQTIQLNLC